MNQFLTAINRSAVIATYRDTLGRVASCCSKAGRKSNNHSYERRKAVSEGTAGKKRLSIHTSATNNDARRRRLGHIDP